MVRLTDRAFWLTVPSPVDMLPETYRSNFRNVSTRGDAGRHPYGTGMYVRPSPRCARATSTWPPLRRTARVTPTRVPTPPRRGDAPCPQRPSARVREPIDRHRSPSVQEDSDVNVRRLVTIGAALA